MTVQFDNVPAPCKIDKVRSRFMVHDEGFLYVSRKQFPLIFVYAVTIHNCQGLSLDCAIVDLSRRYSVMEWHMLLRVRSLDHLFLTAFDPQSISVSVSSLEEVNHFRKTHRPDLPLYDMPHVSRRKMKLTAVNKTVSPSRNKVKVNPKPVENNEDYY